MTSFATLMALSAKQTQQTQRMVENQLQERKRKEALQRKQQEEKEAKEREQERKIRMRRLEEEKRQQERLKRLEDERKAKEAALQRREDEQRDSLRYGPKKAAKMASTSSGPRHTSSLSDNREATRKRRDADDSDQDSGVVLTREELRQRKQQQEMRKLFHTPKRPTQTTSRAYGKVGMRLPGGAVNIVTNQGQNGANESPSDYGSGSVRERLAAMPNTLVMLNIKKRDKRTEDEIQMQVRAARKVLEGAEATQFSDWFGDKKKEAAKGSPAPPEKSASPASGRDTPVPRSSVPTTSSASSSAPASQKSDPRASKPSATKPATIPAYKPAAATSRASSYDKNTSFPESKPTKIHKAQTNAATSQRASSSSISAPVRVKRPRSPSFSDSDSSSSPRPTKKRSAHKAAIRNAIWGMFGKNRDEYTAIDAQSDDEDMEADATALEREEKRSARIAKEEDLRALAEERRHEERKRQRRKEKERDR